MKYLKRSLCFLLLFSVGILFCGCSTLMPSASLVNKMDIYFEESTIFNVNTDTSSAKTIEVNVEFAEPIASTILAETDENRFTSLINDYEWSFEYSINFLSTYINALKNNEITDEVSGSLYDEFVVLKNSVSEFQIAKANLENYKDSFSSDNYSTLSILNIELNHLLPKYSEMIKNAFDFNNLFTEVYNEIVPIDYSLIGSINAGNLKKLLIDCVNKLYEVAFYVDGVEFNFCENDLINYNYTDAYVKYNYYTSLARAINLRIENIDWTIIDGAINNNTEYKASLFELVGILNKNYQDFLIMKSNFEKAISECDYKSFIVDNENNQYYLDASVTEKCAIDFAVEYLDIYFVNLNASLNGMIDNIVV